MSQQVRILVTGNKYLFFAQSRTYFSQQAYKIRLTATLPRIIKDY